MKIPEPDRSCLKELARVHRYRVLENKREDKKRLAFRTRLF